MMDSTNIQNQIGELTGMSGISTSGTSGYMNGQASNTYYWNGYPQWNYCPCCGKAYGYHNYPYTGSATWQGNLQGTTGLMSGTASLTNTVPSLEALKAAMQSYQAPQKEEAPGA